MTRALQAARRSRLHQDEAGISLIEMMVAILIMGLALSAFAQSLIKMLQTTTANEQRVAATAVAQRFVEQLSVINWEFAALYADEVVPDGTPEMTRWKARIDDGQVDGATTLADLVTRPAETDRNPNVPLPTGNVLFSSTDYNVDRYITWVDRDGDGAVETKRFTAWVQWEDRFGNLIDAEFTAERTPTQEEAASADSGLAIIQFVISPQTVVLDANGKPTHDVVLLVKANAELAELAVEFETATNPVFDPVTGDVVSVDRTTMTRAMTPTSPLGPSAGWTTWTYNLVTNNDAFFNGLNDFSVTGKAAGAPPQEIVFDTEATTMTGGPFGDDTGGTPPSGSSQVTTVTATAVTSCKGTKNLAAEVIVKVKTKGVTATTGNVTVQYEYWTQSNGNTKATATIPAPASSFNGNSDNGEWTAIITVSDSEFFKKNQNITITGIEASATDTVAISAPVGESNGC